MFFDFGREFGFPTIYLPNQTAVTVDVLEIGWVTAFLIVLFSFLISQPWQLKNISLFIRIFVFLAIGLCLVLGNFGQEWEISHIETRTPYKAGVAEEIDASIGLKIGLRGVNVTLKSDSPEGKLQYETINYNERFSWEWDQGRFGFGPYAGHIQREFRAAQYRGLPLPILWVVDYFVIDGEGYRHGRFYRTAGWYSHIALWCAFTCWILAAILFRTVIRFGAYCLATCGGLQLLATLLWTVIRNPKELVIPFVDATIKTKFGVSFWLTFVSGILNVVIAIVIIFMDYRYDSYLYPFFGVDPLNSYDEVAYLTKTEQLLIRQKNKPNQKDDEILLDEIEMPSTSNPKEEDYQPVYIKRHTTAAPPVIRSNKPTHLLNKMHQSGVH